MVVCWSVRGGTGVSVVAAAIAQAAGPDALLVDLDGDQPMLLGIPEPDGPGLAEWAAAPEAPLDALARLEVPAAGATSLLPRGQGPIDPVRGAVLLGVLAATDRPVVVDAGRVHADPVREEFARAAERSLVVCPACPLALRHHGALDPAPTAAIAVRGPRRTVRWQEIAARVQVPVLAEVQLDPAVAAAVDAGLRVRAFPRSLLRALEGIA